MYSQLKLNLFKINRKLKTYCNLWAIFVQKSPQFLPIAKYRLQPSNRHIWQWSPIFSKHFHVINLTFLSKYLLSEYEMSDGTPYQMTYWNTKGHNYDPPESLRERLYGFVPILLQCNIEASQNDCLECFVIVNEKIINIMSKIHLMLRKSIFFFINLMILKFTSLHNK